MFVPLATSAGNEQAHNARNLVEAGAAGALMDAVSPEQLREVAGPLLTDHAVRTDAEQPFSRHAGCGGSTRRRPPLRRFPVASGPTSGSMRRPSARSRGSVGHREGYLVTEAEELLGVAAVGGPGLADCSSGAALVTIFRARSA